MNQLTRNQHGGNQEREEGLKETISLHHKLTEMVSQTTESDRDKNSSIQTIFTISNGMVGSAAIVLPALYLSFGILNGVIISFIICVLSGFTTQLILQHNLESEMDLPDTIKRILGDKMKTLFNIVSIGFLFACGLINIILITQLLYPFVQTIADVMNFRTTEQVNFEIYFKSQFSLSCVSYQLTGLVYLILIFPLFLIKRIGPLLKLLSYGAVSICTSVLFIVVKGALNLSLHHNVLSDNIKYTSPQFATLSGVFSLAFLGQSMIIPISKNNRIKNNTKRDTAIGIFYISNLAYFWTFLVYTLIGTFGSFALTTQTKRSGTSGTTILDFYPTDDYMAITIQTLMFFQLTTAFPVLQWITKSRFFGLFSNSKNLQEKYSLLFSVLFGLFCLAVQMSNTNLSLLISYSGSVVGLFMEYLIPVLLHLKCSYIQLRNQDQNQVQDVLVDVTIFVHQIRQDMKAANMKSYYRCQNSIYLGMLQLLDLDSPQLLSRQ